MVPIRSASQRPWLGHKRPYGGLSGQAGSSGPYGFITANSQYKLFLKGEDGNGVDPTDSGYYIHEVTAVSAAACTTTQQKFGSGSVALGGTTDYLTVPVHSSWNLSAVSYTIEFWARAGAGWTTQDAGLFRLGSASNKYMSIYYDTGNAALTFGVRGDVSATPTLDTIDLGVNLTTSWQHFRITCDGTTITVRVDGVSKGTSALSQWDSNPQDYSDTEVEIGRGGVTPVVAQACEIDNFVIWAGITSPPTTSTPPTVPPDDPTSLFWQDFDWSSISASRYAHWDFSDATSMYTDDGSTLVSSDGDSIYRINDQSGNGRHLRQSNATYRPLYKTNIQNSRSCCLFDGSDDFLDNSDAAGTWDYMHNGSDWAVAAAFESNTGTGEQYFLNTAYWGDSTDANPTFYMAYNNVVSQGMRTIVAEGGATVNIETTTSANSHPSGTFGYFAASYRNGGAGDDFRAYTNGQEDGTQASANNTPHATGNAEDQLKLGNTDPAGYSTKAFSGYAGEVVMLSGTIGDTDVEEVSDYLRGKWG